MKLALCNEVLGQMNFAAQCEFAAKLGYQGLELAPFTISLEPQNITAPKAAEIRRIAEDAGTPIAGLHWLLVTPEGLSITTDDYELHAKTTDLMRHLIDLAVVLGADYLVHGSPGQRRLPEAAKGQDVRTEARTHAIEAWAKIAVHATAANVTYCIEALAAPEANFVNTVAEAADIVDQINLPGLRTMIDCSAASVMEEQPVADLIDQWMPSGHIAHIQVNDENRRGPGQGETRFDEVFAALKRQHYDGWIGVEPFVYEPDGPATAAYCAGYLKKLLEK